jgi:adenylate kinase
MMVAAVVGLSGVGKSTLISEVFRGVPLLHLQASTLIKSELERRSRQKYTSEDLRLGAVMDNQELLVAGFKHATRRALGLVVFDGHTLIDSKDGLLEIPACVFADIGCDHMAVIIDEPAAIALRRERDGKRYRPLHALATLAEHQEKALMAAQKIASDLSIPISVHPPSDRAGLEAVLIGLLQTQS